MNEENLKKPYVQFTVDPRPSLNFCKRVTARFSDGTEYWVDMSHELNIGEVLEGVNTLMERKANEAK